MLDSISLKSCSVGELSETVSAASFGDFSSIYGSTSSFSISGVTVLTGDGVSGTIGAGGAGSEYASTNPLGK